MKKMIFSLIFTVAFILVMGSTVHADSYTIRKGDTLWGISQKFNVSVQKLKERNSLSSNLIYPNQTLEISANVVRNTSSAYTVRRGDTLSKIANANGVSVNQLMSANNLSSTLIYPGDRLVMSGQASAEVQSNSPTKKASAPKKSSSNEKKSTVKSSSTNEPSRSSEAVHTFTAEATAYTAFCNGCSGVTATGIDLRANPNQKVIAVDPSVIPLGSRVYVEGYGTAIAGDTGGAINGNRIDVFIPNKSEALKFGRRSVTVKVLSK
ncbi:LysM peptidoglycan-binding and 3D domain-containing protein [Halobacillus salinus]|uniref:LysM peptidoglycan-binding domain-containing protein n=1 Tax=Halobacillus salinus TaxID=192814 RepID=A0A4Z0H2L9_9BACI|nr:3D domain-containing protein [Halobacillus salinus]TGB04612.1 LysM peptidoglycan-binding domain-containing protein [Halobacillus salinus]